MPALTVLSEDMKITSAEFLKSSFQAADWPIGRVTGNRVHGSLERG